jgi:hypothetical protein
VKGLRFSIVAILVIGLLAGAAVGVVAQEGDAQGLPGLVTEEVEPGVERIVSDGAGHDLDEQHPTYRYDMDGVFVAPDGTVWLTTSYRGTDNDANPPGALIWALGQSGTPQYPADRFCFTEGRGVTCWDPATGTETSYLAGTPINQVAVAPDGTWWAVGADGAENGGLYRITVE